MNAIQRYRVDDGGMIEMVCAENNVSYFDYDVVPIPGGQPTFERSLRWDQT
jgi:hypothetical protein